MSPSVPPLSLSQALGPGGSTWGLSVWTCRPPPHCVSEAGPGRPRRPAPLRFSEAVGWDGGGQGSCESGAHSHKSFLLQASFLPRPLPKSKHTWPARGKGRSPALPRSWAWGQDFLLYKPRGPQGASTGAHCLSATGPPLCQPPGWVPRAGAWRWPGPLWPCSWCRRQVRPKTGSLSAAERPPQATARGFSCLKWAGRPPPRVSSVGPPGSQSAPRRSWVPWANHQEGLGVRAG